MFAEKENVAQQSWIRFSVYLSHQYASYVQISQILFIGMSGQCLILADFISFLLYCFIYSCKEHPQLQGNLFLSRSKYTALLDSF
jgi:hypothetical protein